MKRNVLLVAVTAVILGLEPPASATGPPWSVKWNAIARCESGGRWHLNTGNGFYGGLQFSLSTWLAMGGGQFSHFPHLTSPHNQKVVAEVTLARQGIGAWPVCGVFG